MIKIRQTLLIALSLVFINCGSEKHKFPLDKRFWDLKDYEEAILELNFGYESDEKLPTFNDPNTRIIVEKLTDQQNFNIILNDKELGLKHKNDVAEKFFSQWKDMTDIYDAIDRKDQYLYDKEMLSVWHFGLALQLKYFELGNEQIKAGADDPNSLRVNNRVNSNVNRLVENYVIYLDKINEEKAFSEEGKITLAEGIDKYFIKLIELYPEANYHGMKKKALLMLKKSESKKIKSSLNNLIELIDSKKDTLNQ